MVSKHHSGFLFLLGFAAYAQAFLNFYLGEDETKRMIGLADKLFYIKNGTVERYAETFHIPLEGKNVMHFKWQSLLDSPITYSLSFDVSDHKTMDTPTASINLTGEVPTELSEFSVSVHCSGHAWGPVGITININFTAVHGIIRRSLELRRKDICEQKTEIGAFDNNTNVDFKKTDTLAEIIHLHSDTTLETGDIGRVLESHTTTPKPRIGAQQDTTEEASVTEQVKNPSSKGNVGIDAHVEAKQEKQLVIADIIDVSPNANIPPHITSPLTEDLIIVDVPNFRIGCKADGNPKPTFQWYRNNKLLDEKSPLVRAYSNGSLVFEGVNSNADGYFQCYANNVHGKSLSVMVPIKSFKEPSAKPTNDSEKMVKEWQAIEFRCADTPPTVPTHIKKWYQQKQTKEIEMDKRIGMDSQGTIRFSYVMKTDEIRYVCGLTPDESGKTIRLYNEVKLKVTSGEEVESEPRIAFTSSNVKGVLGRSVTLECFFSGYPVPDIQWWNNTNEKVDGNPRYEVRDFGRILVIKKVQENDEGTFKCNGVNRMGSTQGFVAVNVTSPPMRVYKEGLDIITSPDARDVTLKCKTRAARGEAVGTPRWYRNGEAIVKANLPYKDRYHFSSDGTELHISDLDKVMDTACFQCNVSNSEGHVFMDGYLRVIKSIKVTKRPSDVVIVTDHNTTYDLTVIAEGDACCEIQKFWHFNGSLIEGDQLLQPPFIYDEEKDTLLFKPSSVSKSDLQSSFGQYRCQVTNTHESVDVYFKLGLKDAEKVTAVNAESSLKIWVIVLICALLAVLIAVGVVVFFLKSNYPRSTYPLERTELQHNLNPEQDLLDQSFQDL